MTSSTEDWSCRISIRWEFDDKGVLRDQVQELPFGGVITDPQEVEIALRRAQAAVLNPSTAAGSFEGMNKKLLKTRAGNNELQFSRNAVCVNL